MAAEEGITFFRLVLVLVVALPLLMAWLFTLFDLARRDDLSGLAKALWLLFVLLVPLVGVVVYFVLKPTEIVRIGPRGMAPADVAATLDTYSRLRDKGDISQEEFERQRDRLLADGGT